MDAERQKALYESFDFIADAADEFGAFDELHSVLTTIAIDPTALAVVGRWLRDNPITPSTSTRD